MITLEQLASHDAIEAIVGRRLSKRWRKPSPHLIRSDGHSIDSWFRRYSPNKRVTLVREALLDGWPWEPLIRFDIPKKFGSASTRPIEVATVLDTARLYILKDWLAPVVEAKLSKVAVAYRQGRAMAAVVREVHGAMKDRPLGESLDVRGFYDSIPHKRLVTVIESLPADDKVKALLIGVARIPSIHRDTGLYVERRKGIAQGLSVSPFLANVSLADFDRHAAHELARFGAWMRRWSDDIIVLSSAEKGLSMSTQIVAERLQRIGFQLKPKGETSSLVWLGLEFRQDGISVPEEILNGKVSAIVELYLYGILSERGFRESIQGLSYHYKAVLGATGWKKAADRLNKALLISQQTEN